MDEEAAGGAWPSTHVIRETFFVVSRRISARAVWAILIDRGDMRGRCVRVYAKLHAARYVLFRGIGSFGMEVTIDAVDPPVRLTATPLQPAVVLLF